MKRLILLILICCASAGASQVTGAGQTFVDPFGTTRNVTSSVCAGGPPAYCAPTSFQQFYVPPIQYTATSIADGGPATGVKFVEPNTGEEIARVSEGQWELGNSTATFSRPFVTDAASEQKICSGFNPNLWQYFGSTKATAGFGVNGGYICQIENSGSAYWYVAIDATTLQTQPILPPSFYSNGDSAEIYGGFSWTSPWAIWGQFNAGSLQYYCILGNVTGDPLCGSGTTTDSVNTILTVNSTNCPNFPYVGSISLGIEIEASRDDNIVEGWGGGNRYVVTYNRATGKCDWWDTFTGTMGGGDLAGVQTGTPFSTVPAPTNTPSLSSTTGSLAAGTYCVEQTIAFDPNVANSGQTLPSSSACITVSASSGITVQKPTISTDSNTSAFIAGDSALPTGWMVYACQEASPPTACTNFTLQSSSVVGWGTSSFTFSSLNTTSAAPPTQSYGGFYIHQCRMALSGTYVTCTTQTQNALVIWQVGTNTQYVASFSGHAVTGYQNEYEHLNSTSMANARFISLSTQAKNQFIGDPLHYNITGDAHPAWQDDNPTDTYPACMAGVPYGFTVTSWTSGNLVSNFVNPTGSSARYPASGFNSVWNTAIPLANEITCTATDGSKRIWRFGVTRGVAGKAGNWSSAPSLTFNGSNVLGNMTQDGKLYVFTSGWDWQNNSTSYNWKPNTAYSLNAVTNDSNGNLEKVTTAGTSGAMRPAWNPAVNGTTTDGTITWTNIGSCSLSTTPSNCGEQVYVMRLK